MSFVQNRQGPNPNATYYIRRPGAQAEGPLDRATIQIRAVPGTLVSYEQSWLSLDDHPDFARQAVRDCVHMFPNNSRYCIKCGCLNPSVPQDPGEDVVKAKSPSPWIALCAFLLPGLPHIILGQVKKGILIMVLILMAWPFVLIWPIAGVLNITFMIDAVKVAIKLRKVGHVGPWEFMPAAR